MNLLSDIAILKKVSLAEQTHTEEFKKRRQETSKFGKANPMYGRSVYEIWTEKHGKKKADELMATTKKKWSESSSGNKNGMFGRPSP